MVERVCFRLVSFHKSVASIEYGVHSARGMQPVLMRCFSEALASVTVPVHTRAPGLECEMQQKLAASECANCWTLIQCMQHAWLRACAR